MESKIIDEKKKRDLEEAIKFKEKYFDYCDDVKISSHKVIDW